MTSLDCTSTVYSRTRIRPVRHVRTHQTPLKGCRPARRAEMEQGLCLHKGGAGSIRFARQAALQVSLARSSSIQRHVCHPARRETCSDQRELAEVYRANTLDEQVNRAYDQYKQRESDILKNSFLQSLKCESSPLLHRRHLGFARPYPSLPSPRSRKRIEGAQIHLHLDCIPGS